MVVVVKDSTTSCQMDWKSVHAEVGKLGVGSAIKKKRGGSSVVPQKDVGNRKKRHRHGLL